MGWLGKILGIGRKVLNIMTFGAANYLWRKFKQWMQPDLPDKQALKVQRQGSNVSIPVVYGERIVGAIIVDKNVQDVPNGLDNELFHVFAVFCYGEIQDFLEFYFNGISWNDKRWRKDPENPLSDKWFTYEQRLGSTTQSAMSGSGKFNRFSSVNSKYEGLACAMFTFQQDDEGSIWNGEPQITARIRGKKCYDPRTGLTSYTENPAIHLLDYLKSPIYGKGLTDAFIDLNSFITVANICDTTQTATIDTQICQSVNGVYSCTGSPAELVNFKRFTHNNIIDTEREVFDNMVEIANSFRGYFPDLNGLVAIACEKEETPVFSFSEANIIDEFTSSVPGRNSRYNRVIVRFPNYYNKFQMDEVCYPEAGAPLYDTWLAEDFNVPQEKTITLESVVYKAEALQIARLMAVISRNSEYVSFTANPTAIECDVGDVVNISSATRGWTNRTFRISKMSFKDDDTIAIEAIQHDNAIYPWVSPTYTNIIGGSNLGDPATIDPITGLAIAYDSTLTTTGRLTWNAIANAFVAGYVVTLLKGTDEIFKIETYSASAVVPKLDVGNYSVQVKARTTIGTFGPVASLSFSLVVPTAPTDISFTVGNFDIEARPVLAGIGLGTTFEFAIGDTTTVRGRGMSMVFASLTPSTNYTIFARAVNAFGVSAWFSKVATTSLDQAKLNPFLTAVNNAINDINNAQLPAVNADVSALEAKFPLAGADIGTGVVTTTHIANAAITNALIADLAISSAKVADSAIVTAKIAAGAVDAAKIAAGAVGSTHIASLAVTAGKIAANAVTTTEIAANAVTTGKIAAAAVTTALLADGAVLAAKLADNAVTTAKVAAAAIDASKIATNAVGSTHLADLAVTAAKVADAAVTTAKLAANAVDASKLADAAVTASKISAQFGGGNLCLDSSFEALSGATWVNYNNSGSGATSRYDTGRTGTGRSRVTICGSTPGSSLGSYNLSAIENGWQTGVNYVVSYYAKKVNGAGMTNTRLQWNNGPQNTTTLNNPALTTSWQRYSFLISWTAGSPVPSSGSFGSIWITALGSWVAGDEIWLDDIQVEQADIISAYAPNPNEILPGTVGTTQIADNAITSAKVIAGAITAGKIAAGAVTATEIASNTITAAQLAANAITAGKIAAGAVTSGTIAAGVVTANELAADSVTTSKIAAGAVTAGRIATGTITANELAADSVTTSKIAAGAVTSARIAAGTITAANIAAGAITANEIAAGAITASKITLTPAGVINEDPGFTDLTAWTLSSANIFRNSIPGGSGVGQYYINTTGAALDQFAEANDLYACDAAKVYKLSAMLFAATGNNRNIYLYVDFYNSSGVLLASTAWGGAKGGYVYGGQPTVGDWRRCGGQFGAGTGKEIPTTAKMMKIGVWLQYSGAGSSAVQQAANDIRLEECASADLIVDGAILASKIAAGAVVAGKIAADAVTAGTIAAGAVTAGKIAANAVTATEIAAGAITTAKIAAGAVTATELAAGSVTTAKLVASAVTSNEIAANAVVTAKIAANAVTATQIAADAITAAKIQAGAITATKLTITGGGVINRDPMLQDTDAWQASVGSFTFQTISDAPVGNVVLRSGANSQGYVNEKFYHSVDITKTYRIRFWVRSSATANGILYFCLRQYSAPGTPCATNGGRSPYKPSALAANSNWVEHSVTWGPADWQSGVKFVVLDWLLNHNGTAGYMEICFPRFEEMAPADLIVDGAIVTSKIAANAVTANEIAAGSITTVKLAASAVTANELAANAVTAAKIAALAITADKIAANTITGDKIAANAITAAHIQAGTITGDKFYANAIDTAILSAGGIDVTSNNYRLRLLTADKPIELKQGTTTVFSVNPDGTGYYKGGLADNTVGLNAVTTEARRAIYPYYSGYAEAQSFTVPATVSAGGAATLSAMTTLVQGDKVGLVFRFADSLEVNDGTPYSSSTYTAKIQRSVGGGTWTDIPNSSKSFTVTGYNYPGQGWPEPIDARSGYYYDVSMTVTDDVPSTNASIVYRVLLTLNTSGTNTNTGCKLQQFNAEKSSFVKNQYSNSGSVMKWVDKETGFTVLCGAVSVNADSSAVVNYGHTLTTVVSAFAQRDFVTYNDWAVGAIAAGTTSATVYNQFNAGSLKWCVLGFTAV